MPELRQDPVTKEWTVVAKERAKRPDDFVKRGKKSDPNECPFDYGNESMTPPEVLAFRPDGLPTDSPDWVVRVVPNKFPAFSTEATGVQNEQPGELFKHQPAYGAHEVVIHGSDHALSLATYPLEQTELVLKAYIARYNHHKSQPYAKYIQIITNHGKEAGASLEHSHSQIFALPVIPAIPRAQLDGAISYRREHGRCVYCDIINSELEAGVRVIEKTERFIALVPYSANLPFKTWVMPAVHYSKFEVTPAEYLKEFAGLLRNTLRRFYVGLADPPLNVYLHTTPPQYKPDDSYHWHFSIYPKLTIPAGFELATNMWINVVTPESAAEFLRKVTI